MGFTNLERQIITAVAQGKSKSDILAEKITTAKCLNNTLTRIYANLQDVVQFRTERNKYEELAKYLKENSTNFLFFETENKNKEFETIKENDYVHTIDNFQKNKESLTNRELEILEMIVVTPFYKTVANRLCIELSTLKTHIDNIFGKFHVVCLAELVAVYYQYGAQKKEFSVDFSQLRNKYLEEIENSKQKIAEIETKIKLLNEFEESL